MVNDAIHWMDNGTVWITPFVSNYQLLQLYRTALHTEYVLNWLLPQYFRSLHLQLWMFIVLTCSGIGVADWWKCQCLCNRRQELVHTANYRHLVPGVIIKRLRLYEFAPKGRDFVSVVRIIEVIFRGNVWECCRYRGNCPHRRDVRIREVSVLERCPYREVRVSYVAFSLWTWACNQLKPTIGQRITLKNTSSQ